MHAKLSPPHVFDVHIRDFQLSPRRRLERFRDGNHPAVINIEPGNRVIALRPLRFLLDRNRPAFPVNPHHAVAFRVVDVVAEDARARLKVRERLVKTVAAVKDVVAQNQRDPVAADERFGDQKGLGNPGRAGLLPVLDLLAPSRRRRPATVGIAANPEASKSGRIPGCPPQSGSSTDSKPSACRKRAGAVCLPPG